MLQRLLKLVCALFGVYLRNAKPILTTRTLDRASCFNITNCAHEIDGNQWNCFFFENLKVCDIFLTMCRTGTANSPVPNSGDFDIR